MPEILKKLDSVPWDQFHHAYGPATNLPQVLRAVAFGSSEERRLALEEEWWGAVIHQGTYSSSAVAVVPFLVEIALCEFTDARHEVVEELYSISMGYAERFCRPPTHALFGPFRKPYQPRFDDTEFVKGSYEAVTATLPELRDACLSRSTDSETKERLSLLFSTFVTRWREALLVLLEAFDDEELANVRKAILLAIADLLSHAKNLPECPSDVYGTVLPRLVELVQQPEEHAAEEIAAAVLCILESGDSEPRSAAIAWARKYSMTNSDRFEATRLSRSGMSFISDFFDALAANSSEQLELVTWLIQHPESDLFEQAVELIDRYCRRYRNGPREFVPLIEKALQDARYQLHHQSLTMSLVTLGALGRMTASRYAKTGSEAAGRLASFEGTLKSELGLVETPASGLTATEAELIRIARDKSNRDLQVEAIRDLGELESTSIEAIKTLESTVNNDRRPIRIAGLQSLQRVLGDDRRIVQLILDQFEDNFIAIPMLNLLGRCGSHAAYLIPELRRFIESPYRYIDHGWISGNITLDEMMIEAASLTLQLLDGTGSNAVN